MTHTLRLPDGRTLGYALSGHPPGPPVFYFHGWPASRLEAALIDDLPVRMIAMDRPGYGTSSPQPGRRLLDWPVDVAALADHLGISTFHVIGVSGGAPYALACASALARVAAVALVSPVPPLTGAHAPSPAVLGEGLCRLRQLGQHTRIGWAVMAAVRLGTRFGMFNPQKVLDGASAPRDTACLTPGLRLRLIEAWREGLRQGVAGAASDARIYASPWGFDFTAITTPVTIWHGTADIVVPPATVEAYAAMPAQRHMMEGEGHYSLALSRSAEIIEALIRC
jgi:pimeloyl-ACP methyl ester carboxylesterase